MKKIRFTSTGKLLQGLKSQHILKKNSLIDKLRIVLLPRSDYTRNFRFSNLAAVVFASSINSWLIYWLTDFSFCSTMQQRKQIFQKLASSCLMPSLHASTLQLPTNIAEIIWVKIEWNGRVRNLTQVWNISWFPAKIPLKQTLKAFPERPWIHFLYLIIIFVQ